MKNTLLEGRETNDGKLSVAHAIVLALTERGPMTFKEIVANPTIRRNVGTRSENSYYTALSRLVRRKYLERGKDGRYALAKRGDVLATKVYVWSELANWQQKDRAWDGKWRMVLFDIPEGQRSVRDYLRNTLRRVGLIEYQRSIWIWPHKLPPFLEKLFESPELEGRVTVMTTFDVQYDGKLRKAFKLQ